MKKVLLICLFLQVVSTINGQIINGDFEDVAYIETFADSVLYPIGWYSGEPSFDGFITTDSYSGEFAMYLNSWYQGNHTVFFYNGVHGIWQWGLTGKNEFLKKAGTPINATPRLLKAFYKFENAKENDSIVVTTILKKYFSVNDSIAVIAHGTQKFPPSENYQELIVPIEKYSEEIPDSIIVQIETSTNTDFCEDFVECNFLTIDDFVLDFSSGTNHPSFDKDYLVFPNPFSNELHIKGFEIIGTIKIFNIVGECVMTLSNDADYFSFDTSNFSSGMYVVEISFDNDKKIRQKALRIN